VVAVRRGDVDDVDLGVGDEVGVAAVGACRRGGVDFGEEGLCAGNAVGGGGGDDGVNDVGDAPGRGGDEEVAREGFGDAAGRWGELEG
jgi:hypothetical protein